MPNFSAFGLRAVTASEIEFTLHGSDASASLSAFWDEVRGAGLALFNTEKERGREQHEVALMPAAPEQTARDTVRLKEAIGASAERHSMRADFSAKPFVDEPGNGLHIHVHLENAAGKNVFYKDDTHISDELKYALGGLLAWMPSCMPIFSPHENSYARFAPGSTAPTTVSWGANNRTTALRLPDSAHDNKRIEHRVAGADADPHAVIDAILNAVHWGITHKAEPGQQIYGDASLAMYGLPKLPATLEEALALSHASPKGSG